MASLNDARLSEDTKQHSRNMVIFAALGLFASVLGVDLSNLDIFGVQLAPQAKALHAAGTELIPGLLGLALIYSLVMFLLSLARDFYSALVSMSLDYDDRVKGEAQIAALRNYLFLTRSEVTPEQLDDFTLRARAVGAGEYRGNDKEIIDLLVRSRLHANPTQWALERIPLRALEGGLLAGIVCLHGIPLLLAIVALAHLTRHSLGVLRLLF